MTWKDPNPDCTECDGYGHVIAHFSDRTKKTIRYQFLFCLRCYPNSTSVLEERKGEVEVTTEEADRYLRNGYTEEES